MPEAQIYVAYWFQTKANRTGMAATVLTGISDITTRAEIEVVLAKVMSLNASYKEATLVSWRPLEG
jgi:hypothetical protein